MPFLPVHADDRGAVETFSALRNAALAVDDPSAQPSIPDIEAGYLRYGWDLEPTDTYLYAPALSHSAPSHSAPSHSAGHAEPVGWLQVELPQRDNRHLGYVSGAVHPDRRRQGHGTAMMRHALDLVRDAARGTVWTSGVEADAGARAFVARFGFRWASHDARRVQRLAEVDWTEVDRLDRSARAAASAYEVQRWIAPTPDTVLADLVEVTAAINDAPMGELTFEPEVYDPQRLRDLETAAAGRDDTLFRVVARDRETGEAAGHTLTLWNPRRPRHCDQGDTAVAKAHRGHRLGLRLKIEMMRWLRAVQPQIETVETGNHVANAHMIAVNEALGYRLEQVTATYELSG